MLNFARCSKILINKFDTEVQINRMMQSGLAAIIKNIKVDVYDWKVPFSEEVIEIDGIRLASAKDIFAFKCEALTGRKAEKDFIDIAEISLHFSMEELFRTFQIRYPHYTKGSIMPILLQPSIFERDTSIQYAEGKSWEYYCEVMRKAIFNFGTSLQAKKEKELDDHDKKIQSLIEQKRKKK